MDKLRMSKIVTVAQKRSCEFDSEILCLDLSKLPTEVALVKL